jgi:hypothetical protein
MNQDDARRLLDRVVILRHASDLDLVLFFARHPHTLLASESLASFLGYELKQIADSLEVLLAAGLIKRTQTPAHAARLYELLPDDVHHDWFQPLLEMSSTRHGRAMLRKALALRSLEEPGRLDAAVQPETKDTTSALSILIRTDQRSLPARRAHRRGGR